MIKKTFGIVAALLIALPTIALAGGYQSPTAEDLLRRIDQLTRELNQVKQELEQVKQQKPVVMPVATPSEELKALQEKQAETEETLEEVTDKLDEFVTNGIGRFDLSGDFRFRLDSTRASIPSFWSGRDIMNAMTTMTSWNAATLGQNLGPMMPMLPPQMQQQMGQVMGMWDNMSMKQRATVLSGMMKGLTKEQRVAMLSQMGASKHKSADIDNDLLYTNRLRLNLKARATENVTFKSRLTMYKIWGMESSHATAVPFGMNGFMWDPNMSRRPHDNTLRVEMAYVNWTNIADLPIWFSIGRRPTVDGPPMQLKYNYDKRYATPVALGVDWTFDGLTLGYMYENPWPGKIRICYGRGYESGFKDIPGNEKFDDVDLYGISWDVINDPDSHQFANIQIFKAADVTNYMEFRPIEFPALFDPKDHTEYGDMYKGYHVGDIYHLSGVYMNRIKGIDFFISGGISRTDNNFVDKSGLYPGLLNAPGEDENHWGLAAYVGVRIPFDSINSKLGLEYNYGNKYWINFTPAADDLYLSKLATRGQVAEVYWIWDIPDTPLSKYGKAFIRAGYQYYWIDYTGSGGWMGKPIDMDDLDDPLNAQQFDPVDRMDNFYLTFEVQF